MRKFAIILGLAVFALDWITKWWVTHTPWLRSHDVIEGFFRIRYVLNEGIAFGLFHDFDSEWKVLVLSGMAVVAVVIVIHYIWTTPPQHKLLFLSLGLLLGGVLGNFTDRIVHGYVVDFIELHWRDRIAWPTFNVADAAITTGVLMILYETFFSDYSREHQGKDEAMTKR